MYIVEIMSYDGSIKLIIGPMFSGKTTLLIHQINKGALANFPAIIIKFHGDSRYESGATITTHSGICQKSSLGSDNSIRIVIAQTLSNIILADEKFIGIDEGQFYPDLIDYCEKWASEGRHVIVTALDGDFARRPFGSVCDLIPLCEYVEKLQGICMECRTQASAFSRRISRSNVLIEIGAIESYRAVCRRCYHISS